MAYLSLYRKWRPQTFEEVVGQDHITRTLSNAVAQDRVAHAYLFSGPRGTGKTSVAKILAKALNCKRGPTPIPCNACEICNQITDGHSIDVLEIDAASNRGIDEIRDLRDKVHFAPTEGRVKVYIIDEVHMLTTEAFNALLKMLEEPPEHVVFVLATTEPHKVLPTILSRCQQFDFRRILVPDIVERLRQIAEAEGIKIAHASLPLIARHAQGSLRDAIGTLDQLSSFTGKKIEMEDVASLLGMVDAELLFEITEHMRKKDISSALLFVNRLVESGRDIRQFVKELTEHLRHLFIIQNTAQPGEIINTTPENLARMEAQAKSLQPFEIMRFMDVLTEVHNEMRWSSDARLLLEIALAKMLKPEVDISLEGLLYRVEELERRMADGHRPVPAPSDRPMVKEGSGARGEEATREESTPAESEPREAIGGREKRVIVPSVGKKGRHPVDIAKVKRAWPMILEQVKKKKISTYALLLECQPSRVTGGKVTLEFNEGTSFHLHEVEKPQNLSLIQRSLKEILGVDLQVTCVLGGEEEPDSVACEDSADSGSLPPPHVVKLVQESFGAEIVDETELE